MADNVTGWRHEVNMKAYREVVRILPCKELVKVRHWGMEVPILSMLFVYI